MTGRSDGHGLGLTIVKRIADLHGWELDVLSQQEEGTTVTVSGVKISGGKECQR